MHSVTRTGLRLFVCATAPGVALLAVVTENPPVMALFAVPGAVVGYATRLDRRAFGHITGGTGSVAGRRLEFMHRSHPRCPLVPRPEGAALDDTAQGRYQARLLRRALGHIGLTPHGLWLRYLGRGGTAGELEIDAYLHDSLHLPPGERDRLVLAANALLDPRIRPHVPTTGDLSNPARAEGFRGERNG